MDIIDIKNKTFIKRSGIIGRGPGELLLPFSINISAIERNSVEVYDVYTNKLFLYNIDSIINEQHYKPTIIFNGTNGKKFKYFQIIRTDSFIIGTGLFPKGRYLIRNVENRSLRFKYDYPDDNTDNTMYSNENKAMIYQGKLLLKPDKKYFAYVMDDCAGIEICMIIGNDIKKVKEIYYYFPKYKVTDISSDLSNAAVTLRNNIFGFIDACVTNEFIYTLYSGRSINEFKNDLFKGNTIYVDRKSTRLNSSHTDISRMPSSA